MTLQREPGHFFYYNNGITIVCDSAEKVSRLGLNYLRVSNPQIINGQQTSRMLALHPDGAASASVLVKVMQVHREAGVTSGARFESLVSRIVANTNWQNAISQADLRANDRRQIEIERALRNVGCVYLRKRMKKGEARKIVGKSVFVIKKEELAQAVAACEMDPLTVREGKNNLFGEHYETIFPTTDATFYLARYWARRQIAMGSRGKPQRGYASWMALHILWSRLGPALQTDRARRHFNALCTARDGAVCKPLAQAINEILAYYRANRGTGASALDHSTLFRKQRGRHVEFEKFWTTKSTRTHRWKSAWSRVVGAIDSNAV